MKLVFAHDHLFKKDKYGNLYTGGSFNNEVWKRYLKHFDEITVIARLDNKIVDVQNKYNNFDLPQTTFVQIPSLSGPVAQFKNRPIAKRKIRSVLKKSDALIARLPSEIGNLAIQVAKELNMPYAVEVVACVWDALWNYGSLQAKIYAPIATYKMKKNVKNAPYVLYVTENFLQQRYPCLGKTTNVSNVEIDKILDENLTKRLNKIENKKQLTKIGMIGNLNNRIKGWDIALKALKLLKKNNIDFEFHVLGDGNTEIWLNIAKKYGIENRVFFHGVLPGGDPVFNWLDNIDVYIQPSFQEGLPRAVIEAMSRGCPVIGSTAGGIPELLNKSCLHKPGDYKMLADKLQTILINKEYAIKMAIENHRKSKLYKKDILDTKRERFWDDFISSFIKNQ